jgi:hypothetical protein
MMCLERPTTKEMVIDLESLLDDARAQIDSLKSAPVVTVDGRFWYT